MTQRALLAQPTRPSGIVATNFAMILRRREHLMEGRIDDAGRHGIDSHAMWCELPGDGFRVRRERSLRRGVGAGAGTAASVSGDIETTLTIEPPPPFDHGFGDGL